MLFGYLDFRTNSTIIYVLIPLRVKVGCDKYVPKIINLCLKAHVFVLHINNKLLGGGEVRTSANRTIKNGMNCMILTAHETINKR